MRRIGDRSCEDGDALLDVDEAAIGTDALNPDTDGDGLDDGEEVLVYGTDPLPEPGVVLQLVFGGVGLAFLNSCRVRKDRRAKLTN